MKAIIFAGGVGTRLWPLSRRSSPKQFERVIGDKSTLQLAAERLLPEIDWKDIYIATADRYASIIHDQLPNILPENIFHEPESRDVASAVGLTTAILYKKYPKMPIMILWSDHIVKNIELFKKIVLTSESIIKNNPEKIIFISQKPRFASQNLGWINYEKVKLEKNGLKFYSFKNFYYRPRLTQAEEFFKNGSYSWNLGYFVTTPQYLWSLFRIYQPEMFNILKEISRHTESKEFTAVVKKLYPKLPKISFDNAILEKLVDRNHEVLVVPEDLGWSDVGAWEALKEALQTTPDQNVIQGKVLLTDCQDTLVYNYTDQLVVTIDLNGFLVINTKDVVLVCHKNSVPKIKKLVEKLADSDNGHLI